MHKATSMDTSYANNKFIKVECVHYMYPNWVGT